MMTSLVGRVDHGTPSFVTFDVLQTLALCLLTMTILPALFSKSVSRMKTWFSLIISLMVYCVSFLLLLSHQAGPDPPLELCIFQASMIYAAPPLVCFCGLTFVIELYLKIRSAILQVDINEKYIVVLLHLAPFVHSTVAWEALLSGLHTIQRDPSRMYCNVSSRWPPMVTGVTVVLLLTAMLSFEVVTFMLLYRERSAARELDAQGPAIFPLRMFIRTAIYTFASCVTILTVVLLDIVDLLPTHSSRQAVLYIFAFIPLSLALLFGSQADIIYWYMPMFQRRDHPVSFP